MVSALLRGRQQLRLNTLPFVSTPTSTPLALDLQGVDHNRVIQNGAQEEGRVRAYGQLGLRCCVMVLFGYVMCFGAF